MKLDTLIGEPWADYGLVDSGNGRKLERYGRYRFIRPEPQALWGPASDDWRASGEFVPGSDEDGGGQWHYAEQLPRDGWRLAWDDVAFQASDSSPTWPRCGAGCASGSPESRRRSA
jgi:23S rRNA (cytosine1962-C5)-methyltransferase